MHSAGDFCCVPQGSHGIGIPWVMVTIGYRKVQVQFFVLFFLFVRFIF